MKKRLLLLLSLITLIAGSVFGVSSAERMEITKQNLEEFAIDFKELGYHYGVWHSHRKHMQLYSLKSMKEDQMIENSITEDSIAEALKELTAYIKELSQLISNGMESNTLEASLALEKMHRLMSKGEDPFLFKLKTKVPAENKASFNEKFEEGQTVADSLWLSEYVDVILSNEKLLTPNIILSLEKSVKFITKFKNKYGKKHLLLIPALAFNYNEEDLIHFNEKVNAAIQKMNSQTLLASFNDWFNNAKSLMEISTKYNHLEKYYTTPLPTEVRAQVKKNIDTKLKYALYTTLIGNDLIKYSDNHLLYMALSLPYACLVDNAKMLSQEEIKDLVEYCSLTGGYGLSEKFGGTIKSYSPYTDCQELDFEQLVISIIVFDHLYLNLIESDETPFYHSFKNWLNGFLSSSTSKEL